MMITLGTDIVRVFCYLVSDNGSVLFSIYFYTHLCILHVGEHSCILSIEYLKGGFDGIFPS